MCYDKNTTIIIVIVFLVEKKILNAVKFVLVCVWSGALVAPGVRARDPCCWLQAPASLHSFSLHTYEASLLQAPSRVSTQLYLPSPMKLSSAAAQEHGGRRQWWRRLIKGSDSNSPKCPKQMIYPDKESASTKHKGGKKI